MAASQNSVQLRVQYYHAFPVYQYVSKISTATVWGGAGLTPGHPQKPCTETRTAIPAKYRLHKISGAPYDRTQTPCPRGFPITNRSGRYSD